MPNIVSTLPIALRRLAADQRGFTAILTALAAAVLMGFAGLAVDVGLWQANQKRMQSAADKASFAAAVAAADDSVSVANAKSIAKTIAAKMGFTDGSSGVSVTVNNPPTSGNQTTNSTAYEVIITQPQQLYFSSYFLSSQPTAKGRAVADPAASPTCVLALSTSASNAIVDSGSAVATFSNCNVDANSSSSSAVVNSGGATMTAANYNIVGNYSGTLTLSPTTGSIKTSGNAIPDPYASRTAPTSSPCGSNPTSPSGGGVASGGYTSPATATTIYPGVYCGGLTAGGPLTLSAGVYVVKDGGFTISGGSSGDPVLNSGSPDYCTSATGKPYVNANGGVTIYLVPSSAGGNYKVAVSSCFAIVAPTSGNTAGIAVWVDKSMSSSGQEGFTGGSNSSITGAIYAPNNNVKYTGSASATSSCTQIVASTVTFSGSADMNHNCSGTGVSDPTTGTVKLVE